MFKESLLFLYHLFLNTFASQLRLFSLLGQLRFRPLLRLLILQLQDFISHPNNQILLLFPNHFGLVKRLLQLSYLCQQLILRFVFFQLLVFCSLLHQQLFSLLVGLFVLLSLHL